MKQELTLRAPDDWHLHLREGPLLSTVLLDVCAQFRRGLVMPNLMSPIKTAADAKAYREAICLALPQPGCFTPFMTLYLTSDLTPDEIMEAQHVADVVSVKWYPKNATTNAQFGISRGSDIDPALLQTMSDQGVILSVHGETVRPDVDPFDREQVFIKDELAPLRRSFPRLKIVLEHITTREAVSYVRQNGPHTAATITAHHLAYNRSALFHRGLRPHWYCLPLLKRETDRLALLEAATSGEPCFFLGTDSAPHTRQQKESSCGCAGCYTAPHALELYASVFEHAHCLDKLEYFSSVAGALFYKRPLNTDKVLLTPQKWTVPSSLSCSNGETIVPLCAGCTFPWKASRVF